MVLFVASAAGWTVFVVHDTILVAIGKPWWAVWRNALFAVVRLGLLIALAVMGLGGQGIVLSWALPIVIWIAIGTVVLALLARKVSRRSTGGTLPSRRAAVTFLGPTAVAQFGTSLLYNQVTVLATERFGDATGAKFFMAWQAVTVVDLSATYFMNSLAVGVAREPQRAAELAAVARKRLLMIFLPLLAIGCVVAGPALWLVFGPEYAEAADVLRLLFVGLAFRLVILHELGVLQALGRGFAYARLQLVSTVLVVHRRGRGPGRRVHHQRAHPGRGRVHRRAARLRGRRTLGSCSSSPDRHGGGFAVTSTDNRATASEPATTFIPVVQDAAEPPTTALPPVPGPPRPPASRPPAQVDVGIFRWLSPIFALLAVALLPVAAATTNLDALDGWGLAKVLSPAALGGAGLRGRARASPS